MQWADELRPTQALTSLRSKVAQEELSPDVAGGLRKELLAAGPQAQRNLAMQVDTVRSFLVAMGGTGSFDAGAAELSVAEYVESVLLMAHAVPAAFAQSVQLRHLDALGRLLQELSSVDAISLVSHKYKEPLEDHEAAALRATAVKLSGPRLRTLLQVRARPPPTRHATAPRHPLRSRMPTRACQPSPPLPSLGSCSRTL